MKRYMIAALLLSGCQPWVRPVTGNPGCAILYPKIAQESMAIIAPNTIASIATLSIVPFLETASGSYSPISTTTGNPTTDGASDMLILSQNAPIDASRPFLVRGLKPNRNYRFFGRAYNATNAKISQESISYTDLAIGTEDRPSMGNLPIHLVSIPFSATFSVQLNVTGRCDYLKGSLYQGNTQVAVLHTARSNSAMVFQDLQGNTTYNLVVEAYKLNTIQASNSLNIVIGNDTTPATQSIALTVPYVTNTYAGLLGSSGTVEGFCTAARFNTPNGVVCDAAGNLFVADSGNQSIRKISTSGDVVVFAGSLGQAGTSDGAGNTARFNNPIGIAIDGSGNIYVADTSNHAIRKITSAGAVSTLAGLPGTPGGQDGTGTNARFTNPHGIAVDTAGNAYVADTSNQIIRKITSTGAVTTLAGSPGTPGNLDGTGTAARFTNPVGIAVDAAGTIYVGDADSHAIRKVTPTGGVTTLAGLLGVSGGQDGTGTSARFTRPHGITIDSSGNIYVAERNNHLIRKVSSTGVVTTMGGLAGTLGSQDGTGSNARFNMPVGIGVDVAGNVYVGDTYNHAIRILR